MRSTNPSVTLRPSQQKIFDTLLGPNPPRRVGVSAAPGSGKTFILSLLAAEFVQRVRDDQEVLVVTLVNAAVDNFRRRVNSFVQQQGLLPGFNYRVCTLHALANEIVRQRPGLVGLSENFTIVDEHTSQLILRDVVNNWLAGQADLLVDYLSPDVNHQRVLRKQLPDLAQGIAYNLIKKAKDARLSPYDLRDLMRDKTSPSAFHDLTEESFTIKDDALLGPFPLPLAQFGVDVYEEYQNRLQRTGLDFDDLIRYAAQCLDVAPDYLARLQQKWPYIMEDEAQDSSQLQESILNRLAGEGNTWVRVGDPNQAIYETFTTANPEHLRQFLRQPEVTGLEMPESGRSSRSIISLANQLIDWTQAEHPLPAVRSALAPPHIQPAPLNDPQPNPTDRPELIFLHRQRLTPDKEIDTIVKSARRWLKQNPDKTVAILDARNKRGVDIATALKQMGVPYVELLKSTSATRSTAGVLGNVLRYLARPTEPKQLATLFRVWQRDHWDEEIYQPLLKRIEQALKKCEHMEDYLWPQVGDDWLDSLPLEVWVEAQVDGWQRQGGDYEATLADFEDGQLNDLAPSQREGGLTSLPFGGTEGGLISPRDRVAQLARQWLVDYRALIQRWQAATILPIDQLVLTVAQDLFTEPTDLALSHKFALVLKQSLVDQPRNRLPQFVEILAEVARNQRNFMGFDEEAQGFEPPPGKVTISTLHRAKGLEWDRVYLMGMNNYSFPSGNSYDSYFSEKWFIRDGLNLEAEALAQLTAVIEETAYAEAQATDLARIDLIKERLRLFYVGLTRAKQELVVTWNSGRQMQNKPDNQPAIPLVALQGWWEVVGLG